MAIIFFLLQPELGDVVFKMPTFSSLDHAAAGYVICVFNLLPLCNIYISNTEYKCFVN